MREVFASPKFKRDRKKMQKRGADLTKLTKIVKKIQQKGTPSRWHKPHRLKGKLKGVLECHIENDWLLTYNVTEKHLHLHRTGTHNDLFK